VEAIMAADSRTAGDRAVRTLAHGLAVAGVGGAVTVASLLSAASCSSSPAGDPLAMARQALADTDAAAARTEGEPSEVVRAAVERFQALFADFSPATVGERARSVYAENAYFNDGFAELEGGDEIAAYLVRSAEAAGEVAIEVHDVAYSGPEIYLRWDMRFTNQKGSKEVVAPGISHLRVNADGRVVFHRDYWDSSGALAEFVPLMPSILGSIRSRL
jgi:limonene-1,2-epoxide hydrolase